jgi:hypothetical protein
LTPATGGQLGKVGEGAPGRLQVLDPLEYLRLWIQVR